VQFEDVAHELIDSAEHRLNHSMGALLAMSATISGLATAEGGTWPFYTQVDFEAFGQSVLKGSGADMVSWSPIVAGAAQLQAWGNYSVSNDAWVKEGLMWQETHQGLKMPLGPFNIPDRIYSKESSGAVTAETGNGPFAPVWQMAGAPVDPSVVNFNLLSNAAFSEAFAAANNVGAQTLSKVLDATSLYGESALSKISPQMPQTLVMTSLFEESGSSQAIGAVVAVLSWDMYFTDVLKKGSPLVHLVVENGKCGDVFTLGINGDKVSLLGNSDNHDRNFSQMGIKSDFATAQTAYLNCGYTIKVYPSQAFVDHYENKDPSFWTIFVVGLLVFVSIVFFVYDLYVEKRQFKYLSSAARSNAIVSSLFPEEVRDRLFGKDVEADKKDQGHYPESSKFRLRDYLSTENATHDEEGATDKLSASERVPDKNSQMAPNDTIGVDMYQTKPIADLFPSTTIMFADIAGYVRLSSTRTQSLLTVSF